MHFWGMGSTSANAWHLTVQPLKAAPSGYSGLLPSQPKHLCTPGLRVRLVQVLKTTQSGYSGFLHDHFTTLPDVGDRIVATSVTATWRCGL